MYNLLIQAEVFLDKVLIKLGHLLILLFKKIVPQSFREKVIFLEHKLEKDIQSRKENIQRKTAQLINNLKAQTLNKFERTKEIDFKTKTIAFAASFADKVKKTPKNQILGLFFLQLTLPFIFLREWFGGLAPKKILMLTVGFSVFALSALNIFVQTKRIVEFSVSNNRTPASVELGDNELEVEPSLPARPDYHKKDAKQYVLTNVKIPVYFEDINELHNVDTELSIQLSNRWTTKYFDKYEHEIHDYLLQTIEPIVPEFPLEDEGRQIIKDKVKTELNNYLQERNIEGKVEDVKVIYLLGT
ncbi:MAG: hypothetical protein JNM93_08215 [Bacteriovoracaceae bacterium]|nr:hypothetical protein [Bacteriovoracaceae bacterium]